MKALDVIGQTKINVLLAQILYFYIVLFIYFVLPAIMIIFPLLYLISDDLIS